MNPSKQNMFISALQAAGVHLPCPRCGAHQFDVIGESVLAVTEITGTISHSGSGQPIPMVSAFGAVGIAPFSGVPVATVVVACQHCGYITNHAQKVLLGSGVYINAIGKNDQSGIG